MSIPGASGWLRASMNPAVPKKILSAFLSLSLCGGSLSLALEKPGAPQPAKEAADEASRRIAAATAAAIRALGASPSARQISTIVFKAVRGSPDSVLPIVAASVRASPLAAAPEIVTASTAAVPNPWKKVIYRRLTEQDARHAPARDGAQNADPGIEMTLAEAIIRTAFDARPGLSFRDLQDAANAALLMDHEALMRDIQSPRAASGTGDVGLSNYANEPFLTPKPPVVSR